MNMSSRPTTTRQNGAAIRHLRRQKGVRVGEFAEQVEAAAPTLTNVENGNTQASWELLYRIAHELEVDISEILSDHGLAELAKVGAA